MTTNDLRELFLDLNVKFDEELKKYTNTKTGGKADVLAFPDSVEETEKLIKVVKNTVPLSFSRHALIILFVDFKICARMLTHRTNFRSFVPRNHVSAIPALPYRDFRFFKNRIRFDVPE